MKTNDFVKQYVKIDNRIKPSKKLNAISSKYKEFARYLDLIQKEDVFYIFSVLQSQGFICYTMVRDDIKHFNFKKWINYLITEEFITYSSEELQESITNDLKIPKKPIVYELTEKGDSFLLINYVREFMEEEQ